MVDGGNVRERKLVMPEEGLVCGAPGAITFLTHSCFDVAYFRNRIR